MLFPCGVCSKALWIDMMNTWYIYNTYIIWFKVLLNNTSWLAVKAKSSVIISVCIPIALSDAHNVWCLVHPPQACCRLNSTPDYTQCYNAQRYNAQ